MGRLRDWLDHIGLSEHEARFVENDVDLDVLPHLTEGDLREMGISIGHRRRILAAVAAIEADRTSFGQSTTVQVGSASTISSRAERRQLTVLFCDLVGSAALSAAMDPEELRELMARYQGAVGAVAERYEGHIAQYLGDGIMVYFGWPQAHEDDAQRAIRAGLEMIAAVRALDAPTALDARVGIATGRVVVGETGGGDASVPKAAVGETPNIAARVQALAQPGEVVTGDLTFRLVGGAFETTDLGLHELKGFKEPVRLYRVVGEAAADSRFETTRGQRLTPLVGREEEIGLLLRRWEQAKESEGQIVLLSGEPGIGKSRITEALIKEIEKDRHFRLRYQASPYYTNSAFHPLISHFERAADFERDDSEERKLDKIEAALAEGTDDVQAVAPLIAAMLSLPTDRYAPLDLSPQRQKEKTVAALVDQVIGLAARSPVLMIVEDAHWIDPTTIEVLSETISRVGNAKVMIVVTFRPEFQPPWSGSHVTSLSLNHLGRNQVEAMIARATDGNALPTEIVDQIVAKADGVPLFVEELTKAVLDNGLLEKTRDGLLPQGSQPSFAVPATLQDSLMARLDRLSPVKEVVQVAACIGREFSHDMLSAVSPLQKEALGEALTLLISNQLLQSRGSGVEATYAFKHTLIQDVAYGSLLLSKRAVIHGQVCHAIENDFPHMAKQQPEILAHHCTAAGLIDKAITYWRRAGDLARQKSANVEAVRHYEKALASILSLPCDHPDRVEEEFRVRIAMGPALMALHGFAADVVGENYEKAMHLSERITDNTEIFPALYGVFIFHTIGGNHQRAREISETYLKKAEERIEPNVLINAHRTIGFNAMQLGDLDRSVSHFDQAIALHDQHHSIELAHRFAQDPYVAALTLKHFPLSILGYFDQAEMTVAAARKAAEQLGHPQTLVYANAIGSSVHFSRGNWERSASCAQQAVDLATELGFPYFAAHAGVVLGASLIQADSESEGNSMALDALSRLRGIGTKGNWSIYVCFIVQALLDAKKPKQCIDILEEGLIFCASSGERCWLADVRHLHGEVLLHTTGDALEAETEFVAALRIAEGQNARLWQLRAATSLGRLWGEQGERQKGYDLLFPVYDWFTEGFDTRDLIEAKALLGELRG